MFEIRRIRQFIRIKTSILKKQGANRKSPVWYRALFRFLNNDGRPDFGGTSNKEAMLS
jgi:hypothetical protein